MTSLIEPYKGNLVDLLVPDAERESIISHAAQLPRIQLTQRNVCDLELLATGTFSPPKRL
jgi:sulfate adenylyltransferase